MSYEAANLQMVIGIEPWRECVAWLMDCGVLDVTHRVGEPDAEIGDFANILRDGVLLCMLCNRLSPNCIDTKDLQQRPQMAQFLCCKNICEFLKACKNTFDINEEDLFDPWDLYRLNDFAKVLKTLSKLSQSPKAKCINHRGFSLHLEPSTSSEYSNDEAIYRSLKDDAEAIDPIMENAYDVGTAEDEKTSGQIYDTIVCQRSDSRRERLKDSDKWSSWKPETRREHCIKELYDTENNYVEKALDMIINNFYTPLEEVMSHDDHKTVFMNILELACVHRSFRDHLRQAVLIAVGLETPRINEKSLTIGEVFKTWKEKFVAYGPYCSQLPESRSRICYLEKNDPVIRQRIIDCGVAANGNQFQLQDLLSIPMQRVLKYHVLLSEMIKLTSIESPDRLALEEAKEAMQDINSYVNEVKRDYEMQQVVIAIEMSIIDLQMPENLHLIDYGRLVKDGEIKISDSSRDGNKLKNRYVFIFDKVMLICKSLRGNQYSYKSAYVLRDYRVEVDMDSNNKFGTLTRKLTANGGHYFSLVQETGEGANVLSMCCKTLAQRDNWVQHFEMAQDNVKPRDAETSGHSLHYHSYEKATICSHCLKLLAGLFFQGYHCTVCKKDLHRACIANNKCRGAEPLQQHNFPAYRRKLTLQPNEIVRAIQTFHSSDNRFLSFEKHDLIEILQQNLDGTVKGRVVSNPQRTGIIPPEFVRKNRPSTSSLHAIHSAGGLLNLDGQAFLSANERGDILASPQLPRPIALNHRSSTDSMLSIRTQAGQDYINTDVASQPWYQGSLERREAESKLRGSSDGTYLVRFSNTQQKYVISISFNGEVKHTKIEQTFDNRFYLDESRMFPSIVELINYYRQHNLRESFETLNTTLRESYTPDRPYQVIHNYDAPDSNFLELRMGQIVYVISRSGEERGWWKGKSGDRLLESPMSDEKISTAKAALERRFRESGECERMKELLLQRLREHGWVDEVENMCKKVVQEKGIENITVENILAEVRGQARRAVPDEVKRELMQCIRSFLQKESGIPDL